MNNATHLTVTLLALACSLAFSAKAAQTAPTGPSPAPQPPYSLEIQARATGNLRLQLPTGPSPAIRSSYLSIDTARATSFRSGQLSVGVHAERVEFQLSPSQDPWTLPTPDRLSDLALSLAYQGPLADRWSLLAETRVGWRVAGSDTLSSDAFGATAIALALYEANPQLRFAVGAALDTLAHRDSRVMPVGGLAWDFAPAWQLALGLPRTGIFYSVNQQLEIGLAADASFANYHVDPDAQLAPYQGARLADAQLEYLETRAGFHLAYAFRSGAQLRLEAGILGERRFEYPDTKIVIHSRSATDAGYASATLNFAF